MVGISPFSLMIDSALYDFIGFGWCFGGCGLLLHITTFAAVYHRRESVASMHVDPPSVNARLGQTQMTERIL